MGVMPAMGGGQGRDVRASPPGILVEFCGQAGRLIHSTSSF